MHAKSFVVDGRVLFTGSVNLTHNGMENNKEHMFRICDPYPVAQVEADFEELWEESEDVDDDMIMKMLETRRQKEDKPSRSKSRSSTRSNSDSLAVELFHDVGDGGK